MGNRSLHNEGTWYLVYDCWTDTAIPARDHRTESICLHPYANEADLRQEALDRWKELPKNDGVRRANPRLILEIWLHF